MSLVFKYFTQGLPLLSSLGSLFFLLVLWARKQDGIAVRTQVLGWLGHETGSKHKFSFPCDAVFMVNIYVSACPSSNCWSHCKSNNYDLLILSIFPFCLCMCLFVGALVGICMQVYVWGACRCACGVHADVHVECMQVCVRCIFICAHAYEVHRTRLGVILRCHLNFLRQSLSLAWDSPSRPFCLTIETRDPPNFAFPALGLKLYHHPLLISIWALEWSNPDPRQVLSYLPSSSMFPFNWVIAFSWTMDSICSGKKKHTAVPYQDYWMT